MNRKRSEYLSARELDVVRASSRSSTGSDAPMEVILSGEIRVRIHAGSDEATLLRLVRALGCG